jgi:triacylglycerol lipase
LGIKSDPKKLIICHQRRNIEESKVSLTTSHAAAPKNPIILAHGLLGFDELHLVGQNLPGIQYWRGIREALKRKNIEVITATVPASGSIEARAARLAESIEEKAKGKSVNIIAYVFPTLIASH